MRLRTALAAVSCASTCLVVSACGGSGGGSVSGEEAATGSQTLEQLWRAPGDDVAVVPGTSSYEAGRIRVSFLVLDAEGRPVIDPTAQVWVARGLEQRPFLETEAKIERIGVPGGAEADSSHIYVARFDVRQPGKYWLLAEPKGGRSKVQALGNVVVHKTIAPPGVGDQAPVSDNPVLNADGSNAAAITTRTPPDVTLLRYSVADSLRTRHPFVVVFATPQFCTSRMCGPAVDVVEEVAHRHEHSSVRFIHVEVYDGNDPANGYNRWMREWGLTTEPWTFVVRADGRVSARFEGPVSVDELDQAVDAVAKD